MARSSEEDAHREKAMERQMGCMAGFLQIFDRNQFLSGKRVASPKRLPSAVHSPAVMDSPAMSPPYESPHPTKTQGEMLVTQAGGQSKSPAFTPDKTRAPAIVFTDLPKNSPGIKDIVRDSVFRDAPKSLDKVADKTPEKPMLAVEAVPIPTSWRLREAPRLSLDSRSMALKQSAGLFPREIRTSIVRPDCSGDEAEDAERQRRSPSVVARLMGLDALPNGRDSGSPDVYSRAELRRSASESRASRELFPSGWKPDAEETLKRQNKSEYNVEIIGRKASTPPVREPWRLPQSKGFESAEIFPDGRRVSNLYGEIERRLKMRGIDEPGKDLQTLKQILEALQLKGLLHSAKSNMDDSRRNRNFVFEDRKSVVGDSPVTIVKPLNYVRPPAPSSPPPVRASCRAEDPRRVRTPNGRALPPVRRQTAIEMLPPVKPRRSQPSPANDRGLPKVRTPPSGVPRSPGRGRDSERSSPRPTPSPPKTAAGRRAEADRRNNRSPAANRKRIEEGCFSAENASKDDALSTVSESSRSTSSALDFEAQHRLSLLRKDEFKEGRVLLDRCDKLLQSIAEATDQPSPVSVLDASFHNEDGSPSSVTKRSIVFGEEQLSENDDGFDLRWNATDGVDAADLDDFRYVSDVVMASTLLQNTQAIGKTSSASSAMFSILESRRKSDDTTRTGRRLIFDTVMEILQRRRQQAPARAAEAFVLRRRLLRQVWSEFQCIRRLVLADDVCDLVSGVIRKDLTNAAGDGWAGCPAETGEAVLSIERLLFKDLVAETIRELAFPGDGSPRATRRQLLF